MQKKHGKEFAKRAKQRIDQINAIPRFNEYVMLGLGNPHVLAGDFEGYYGVSLTGNTRIILKPISEDLSVESLSKCEEVILKGVVDYHGQKDEWIIP